MQALQESYWKLVEVRLRSQSSNRNFTRRFANSRTYTRVM